MPNDDELLTVAEVAEILKLHEQTARKWVREGKIPSIYLGSRQAGYRVKRSTINRIAAEGFPSPESTAA
jgi:excisionase family DNA binding protein